jgi:hypothetical protein
MYTYIYIFTINNVLIATTVKISAIKTREKFRLYKIKSDAVTLTT